MTAVPNEIYITSPDDCRPTADADFADSCLSCDCRWDDSGAGADSDDDEGRGREKSAPSPPSLEELLLVAGLTSEPSRETQPATLRRRNRQGAQDERTKTTGGPGTFQSPPTTGSPRSRTGAGRRARRAPEQQPEPPTAAAFGRRRMLPTFADFAGHSPLPFEVKRKANGSLNFIPVI